jgi:hypothetical protein
MKAASQGNKRAMQRLQELKKLGKAGKRIDKSEKNADCTIF